MKPPSKPFDQYDEARLGEAILTMERYWSKQKTPEGKPLRPPLPCDHQEKIKCKPVESAAVTDSLSTKLSEDSDPKVTSLVSENDANSVREMEKSSLTMRLRSEIASLISKLRDCNEVEVADILQDFLDSKEITWTV